MNDKYRSRTVQHPPSTPSSELHDSIIPADIRPQERVVTRIKAPSSSEYEAVRTWRVSPLGIEVEQTKPALKKGEKVGLEIVISGQRTQFDGTVVTTETFGGQEIAGIRFSQDLAPSDPSIEKRQTTRWTCSENFYPLAVAPSPAYFDEWMYFQIHDISENGMQLNTSLSNKYLVPGLTLQLTAVFPIGGAVQLRATIVRVNVGSFGTKDRLVAGVKFSNLDRRSKSTIGQYLTQFSPSDDLEGFQAEGFIPRSVLNGIRFRHVKSDEHYRQALRVRFEANSRANQLGTVQSEFDLADMEDSRSRILIGLRNDKVVATMRVRFPTREDPLEAEKYSPWPEELPKRETTFEVSRLAVLPGYQGGDLLAGLLRFLVLTCVNDDRRHGVMSSMKKYTSFYEKIGLKHTGITYKDENWSDELHVMTCDIFQLLRGRGVNPFYWNLVWKDVADKLVELGEVETTGLDRVRMNTFRLLGPLSQLFLFISRHLRKFLKRAFN